MIQKMKKWRGQSTLEYAVLVIIIIAALLSLQAYIKRGVQGRLRKSTDDIGEQYSTTTGSNSSRNVTTHSESTDTVDERGVSVSLGAGKTVTTNESTHLGANEYATGTFGSH